jgi:hypothetical protein
MMPPPRLATHFVSWTDGIQAPDASLTRDYRLGRPSPYFFILSYSVRSPMPSSSAA